MKKTILRPKALGFTLIEVLIALAVFATAISGVLSFNSWVIGSIQSESAKSVRNVENIEMLKLLTQPIFFGAQSKYDENKVLRECMSLDSVECDASKVYQVTPYDIAADKPLDTASTLNDSSVKNKVTFQVHCPNKQPTCDKADYFTVNVKTYLNFYGLPVSIIEKNGIVAPEFTNVVTFVPDAIPSPSRPINILLFLDNSNSMVFAKDQIKTALNNLIDKISSMDVTLGIYGLASISTELSRRYVLDADGNQQPLPPPPLPGGFSYYQASSYVAYYHGKYLNQDPALFLTQTSTTRVFNFVSTDTPEFRAQKKLAIQNLIEGLYSNPTSSLDEPFCAILRLLETPGQTPPFQFDTFTPTVIFIISNENDETFLGRKILGGCEKSYLVKWTTNPPHYYVGGYWGHMRINVTANVKSDGAPAPPMTLLFSKPSPSVPVPFIENADCMSPASEVSKSEIELAIKTNLDTRANSNLTYTTGDGYTLDSCLYYRSFVSFVTSSEPISNSESICSQVESHTYPGQTYSNYITGTCKTDLSQISGASGSTISSEKLYPSTTTPTDAIYQAIKSKLNIENVYYMPIVHPDATTCTMTEGSQVGTRYMDLAAKSDLKSTLTPICSPSFSSGLDKLKSWTETLGADDISLPATVAANFKGVEILRGSTVILLTANVDYRLSGAALVFTNGLLQPNDIIKVYLK